MTTVLDTPIPDALAVDSDLADMLSDLANGNDVSDLIREQPAKSMVRMGDKPLPDRLPVYDERGVVSMVPTAAIRYHLTKRNAETGRRAFYLKPPEGLTLPQPIAETCPDCTKSRNGVVKPFYDEMDLERHKRFFHPLETEARERIAEREERRGGGILSLLASMAPEEKAALRAFFAPGDEPKPPARKGAA